MRRSGVQIPEAAPSKSVAAQQLSVIHRVRDNVRFDVIPGAIAPELAPAFLRTGQMPGNAVLVRRLTPNLDAGLRICCLTCVTRARQRKRGRS
jgi:hypothetical protein